MPALWAFKQVLKGIKNRRFGHLKKHLAYLSKRLGVRAMFKPLAVWL